MKLLRKIRLPTLDLPLPTRRRLWKIHFFRSYLVVFIGYMAMYLIRKNFNVSQNELIQNYGFTKTELGQIGFWFSMTYGVGKTLVGYAGDGRNTKNFLALLLILSALSMFGFASGVGSLSTMIFCFALNGMFQSAGGPLSYATITQWTVQSIRGRFLGLWNISHNVGGALAAFVATFGAEVIFGGDVRGMFVFPAVIALVVGVGGLFVGADSPEAVGLGKAEEIFKEKKRHQDDQVEKLGLSKWSTVKKYVLRSPFIWGLCFANVFVYVVRIGVDQWGIVYAKEVLGLSVQTAKTGFTLFEVGALSGAFIWGYLSDLTKGRSSLVSIVAMALILIALGVYQNAHNGPTYWVAMFALGFLIFAPQLLIGVSAVFFVPKNAVSVTDGIRGTFGYLLGDSFAKLGLGMMADNKMVFGMSGWDGTFKAMYIATVLGIICLTFVAIGEEKKIRRNAKG
jgi:OPA family hexose phosphate transport protein UhpT-like MFS transporter